MTGARKEGSGCRAGGVESPACGAEGKEIIRWVSREAAKGKFLGSVRAPKWRVGAMCEGLAGDALTWSW